MNTLKRLLPLVAPVAIVAGAGILSLILAAYWLDLGNADFRVPWSYSKDGVLHGMLAKGLLENGTVFHNANLGLPGGLVMHDFPKLYGLQFLGMRVLGWFSHDYAVVMNVYFLLTFPFATVTMVVATRRRGAPWPCAYLGGLLFAFLAYHFVRGENHLLLAAYGLVPLVLLVTDWLLDSRPLLLDKNASRPVAVLARDGRTWASLAIVVAVALSGVYYAAFTTVVLVIAAVYAGVRDHSWHKIAAGVVLVGFLTAAVLANGIPSYAYWRQHGRNPQVTNRTIGESETFGLKLSTLVLPATNHRVPAFAKAKEGFNRQSTLVNENDDASLGILGSCGLVLLLVLVAWPRAVAGAWANLRGVGVMAAGIMLVGAVGGVGSLISWAGLPEIRSYNRVSVFLALFALTAVTGVLSLAWRRWVTSRGRAVAATVVLGALTWLALLDQIPARAAPEHAATRARYANDAAFVAHVESSIPAGGMVFELPVVDFPESKIPRAGDSYAMGRPYLHARSSRWSFGAMPGRSDLRWQKDMAARPPEDMVAALKAAGFAGIFVERKCCGYEGRSIEVALARAAGRDPIANADGDWVFFVLRPR